MIIYNYYIIYNKNLWNQTAFVKITYNFVVSYRACHSVLKLHVQMYIQFTELLIK